MERKDADFELKATMQRAASLRRRKPEPRGFSRNDRGHSRFIASNASVSEEK